MNDPSDASDWEFCKDYLVKLSRSFSIPITMLDSELERVVTCGYLLCRIVDTVEDRASIATPERDELYAHFINVLQNRQSADPFTAAFKRIVSDGQSDGDEEAVLACGLHRVLRILDAAHNEPRQICRRWVTEMARGMAIYSHREPGADGITALSSLADLDRYCYFVAGTVGHMLTGLFLWSLGDEVNDEQRLVLQERCEEFGGGLQLVNIIKDMSEDLERAWSFMPRTLWAREGLTPKNIVEPAHRKTAHTCIAPVFDVAWEKLDRAFEYALAIPTSAKEIRLFCLVPLWMAAATLEHAYCNDDLFVTGRKVKISREQVGHLVQSCTEHCQDNDALRGAFNSLRSGSTTPSQCQAVGT